MIKLGKVDENTEAILSTNCRRNNTVYVRVGNHGVISKLIINQGESRLREKAEKASLPLLRMMPKRQDRVMEKSTLIYTGVVDNAVNWRRVSSKHTVILVGIPAVFTYVNSVHCCRQRQFGNGSKTMLATNFKRRNKPNESTSCYSL